MKTFHIFPLFLFALTLLTACEKPEKPEPIDQNPLGDKPPCYGSFKCTINGEPFQSYGTGGGCSPRSISYGTTNKYLIVMGRDCRVNENDFLTIVFDAPNVTGTGHYPITLANCGFLTVLPQSYAYNQVIEGEVIIEKLIPPPYSEDFKGGYIEGTFRFTSYSEEANDTAKVTNGEFCGTF